MARDSRISGGAAHLLGCDAATRAREPSSLAVALPHLAGSPLHCFFRRLVAEQLIGSRHEVVPAQPRERRALGERRRDAADENPLETRGGASFDEGPALHVPLLAG